MGKLPMQGQQIEELVLLELDEFQDRTGTFDISRGEAELQSSYLYNSSDARSISSTCREMRFCYVSQSRILHEHVAAPPDSARLASPRKMKTSPEPT